MYYEVMVHIKKYKVEGVSKEGHVRDQKGKGKQRSDMKRQKNSERCQVKDKGITGDLCQSDRMGQPVVSRWVRPRRERAEECLSGKNERGKLEAAIFRAKNEINVGVI
jgi:hypothetical protein